jgi:hypothetical protein
MFKKMSLALASCLVTSIATPSHAWIETACDEAWLIQGIVLDRLGYCFSSRLGEAYFNEDGCWTTDPELPDHVESLFEKLRETMTDLECEINISRRVLDEFNENMYFDLDVLPAVGAWQTACIDWQGEQQVLRAAPREDAYITGFVRNGDDVEMNHYELDGWDFVISGDDFGWAPVGIFNYDAKQCARYAG